MFIFGKRTVIKQGGSYMISLPMQWMKSMGSDLKTVIVEMDSEKRLRIIAGDILQDTATIKHIHSGECQRILFPNILRGYA
jgi:polysaccharide deacetylase 2 family uncharacterized protein YibQ